MPTRVSYKDIQLLQNLIESCMQQYMKSMEIVEKLQAEYKINPGFTQVVWKKLEEENQEFFRRYRLMLQAKDQMKEFNRLLQLQAEPSLKHGTQTNERLA